MPDIGYDFADVDAVIARAMGAWRPPPLLSLSAWADKFFVLSAETAAEPGRWRSLPYQREVMDAITDSTVPMVVVMKGARVGYTLMLSAAIGYFMTQDPSSMLIVQPTVDDAKGFSKETIAPMLRDVPVLSRIVFRDVEEKNSGPKGSATLLHKAFPGGVLSLAGANSETGLRRISRRVVMFDEVDGYPLSAGAGGDPVSLGLKRSEAFHNRKAVAGSTPLVSGTSRIEELFLAGDQRRYHVPCPHCGFMDFLVFERKADRGHVMRWPAGKPKDAYFECRGNGCKIEHKDKRWIIERGEWRPDNPGAPHRSYHIWAAMSYSPNATWAQIVERFLAAKDDPQKLRTFVNTDLGETWVERGEAPEWERLYARREPYTIRSVPDGAIVLTCGVDVQQDHFRYEVVGWAPNKESWSVDAGIIWGDTAVEATWSKLDDELLARTYENDDGAIYTIAKLAIDSGYRTQMVYSWARKHPFSRVIAVKGDANLRAIIGSPSPVEITVRGKKLRRGYKIWAVGVNVAKDELYGWLGLTIGEDGMVPAGYCHFPEYDEDFFKQLTAEHLVTTTNKRTHRTKMEWQVLPNRPNHHLDTRVYARAAAALLGLDKLAGKKPKPRRAPAPPQSPESAEVAQSTPQPAAPAPRVQAPAAPRRTGWINSGRPRGSFMRRR